MIVVSNIRKEKDKEWTKLVVDINLNELHPEFLEKTMWFAIKNEYADFLSDENYDPFILIPYIIGMCYNEPVKIEGCVSKTLYKNIITYANQILDDFSDKTRKVELLVNGFNNVNQTDKLVGTSCSCGIDSLTSLFDHFENENDKEYKINSLFLFNCGTHGDYNENSKKLYEERFRLNSRAAKEMNIPVYQLDSNIHSFSHVIATEEPFGYLSIYSCILALQSKVCKYYVGSDFCYSQTLKIGNLRRDIDLSEYNAASFVPLIYTDNIKLILDGAQYYRSKKTEKLSDWKIANDYMNICITPHEDGTNCTIDCYKCRTAMIIYDALGKLDNFKNSFDIDSYKKNREKVKRKCMKYYYTDPFTHDAVDYVISKGFPMPPKILGLPTKIKIATKNKIKKIIGYERTEKLKKLLRH